MRISDHYVPFARQREFHESTAKYRLFGGAAGPGKTLALLWEAIRQANRYPGVETLLLRRTFPELEMSLLKEFRLKVPRELYRKYNDAKRVVTWRNGSTTRFGYCRNEKDVYQYQGAEFLFIGLDELTHFTLKQWQFLTSRNRCAVPETVPNMAGATNPGNIGHAWVKALWIDREAPDGWERTESYRAQQYEFIRAKISDNPIYANDEAYRETLNDLPSNLRRAMLEGDWDIFAGQYFDIFDLGRHTARPEEMRRERWWPIWISIDWGFKHPSAVYWHTKKPDERGGFEKVITYRELVQPGLSPRMLGQAIVEKSEGEEIDEVYLSPDAFAHRTTEASIAEQLGEVLASGGLPQPGPADDDRVSGWQHMYQLLEGDEWIIGTNCERLIKCLPGMVRDEKRVEDIAKVDGDDPADAARYGLVHLKRQRGTEPVELRVARKMAKTPLVDKETGRIKDMTSYAIHAQKLEAEARKGLHSFRPGRRR